MILYIASRFFGKSGSMIQYVGYYIYYPPLQRSARSSHRPRNDRGMSKNSLPRSRLDLGLSLILVSSLVSVSKKVKNPRNSSFFPRNDRGMSKKSSPWSRLDLGLGQANRLELDLGLEKGALADLWFTDCLIFGTVLMPSTNHLKICQFYYMYTTLE